MAKTEITLVIPGLAPVLHQEINNSILPSELTTMLRKGCFHQHADNLSRLLTRLFSVSEVEGDDLPLATLRECNTSSICADPCYLHADRDQLLVFADDLSISDEDAEQVIATIQPLLAEFDASLVKHNNAQWSLQLQEIPDLTFTALADVSGKPVQAALPKGDSQQRQQWIRLWNEIQMSLFESPVNIRRQQQGLLPINSLWFWGKGELDLRMHYWQSVSGSNLLLQQLAQQSQVPDISINSVSYINHGVGRHLIVSDSLDLEGDWQTQLSDLSTHLRHFWQQLKWKKIDNLSIEIPDYGQIELSPFSCWKPW